MTAESTTTFRTVDQIKRAAKTAGNYFFTAESMKAWHSRVLPGAYPIDNGAYFVTSEALDSERAFTVRLATVDADGFDITTAGDFMGYATPGAARAAAAKFARNA